jgi:hypothetical protein
MNDKEMLTAMIKTEKLLLEKIKSTADPKKRADLELDHKNLKKQMEIRKAKIAQSAK